MSNLALTQIEQQMARGVIPPFVYCYPTRSAYRPLDPSWQPHRIWQDDRKHSATNELNLYIHVPFCQRKCGFCNLYTMRSTDEALFDAYAAAICLHLEAYRQVIEERRLCTVYIGGGTPSLLSRRHFDSIFRAISKINPQWRRSVEEVCIEATPDSIVELNGGRIEHLTGLGLTRVNLGIQSLANEELKEAGRAQAGREVVHQAISILQHLKLPNLSTDLMMGFHGQSDETWRDSVVELVQLAPDTISTYFLTIRPDASFSRAGRYTAHRGPELYDRYDVARRRILDAGYVQETNVRYKKLGSDGYRQKILQFRGVPCLGIGAGARTYTNTVDYIVGGSDQPQTSQVERYIREVSRGGALIGAGFVYDDDERIRKSLTLNLFDLDTKDLERYRWQQRSHEYRNVLDAGLALDLLREVGRTRYQLTEKGMKYRDILSWMLFSRRVRQLDREFYQGIEARNQLAQRRQLEAPTGLSTGGASES